MSVAADLRAYLLADTAIAEAAGTRAYPDTLPQAPTLPAIVYHTISRGHAQCLGGITDAGTCRVQLDCIATTRLAADALADLVVARLKTLAATPTTIGGGTPVCEVEIQGPRSDADEPSDGSDDWQYTAQVDAVMTIG